MNKPYSKWHRLGAIIALTGVMLRALIADGVMLSRSGDELALTPCPVRSPALAQLARNDAAQAHHHHGHHHHGGDSSNSGSAEPAGSCPYALASAPGIPPSALQISFDADVATFSFSSRIAAVFDNTRLRPPATGPPALLS